MSALPNGLLRMLALRSLNLATPLEVIEWARHALGDGVDSESLRVLAGLSDRANEFELDSNLQRAGRELGYCVEQMEQSVTDYVCEVARDIVADAVRAKAGTIVLGRLARASGRDELHPWDTLAEEFAVAHLTGTNLPALIKRAQDEAQALISRARG